MTRKREYVFASFNNDRRLSLGDKQIIAWAEIPEVDSYTHNLQFQRDKVPLSTPPLTQH